MNDAHADKSGSPVSGAAAAAELLCIQCGYRLRGLPPEHNCPECGLPLARSLHGRWLAQADLAWLERVRRGQFVLLRVVQLMLYGGIPIVGVCPHLFVFMNPTPLVLAVLGLALTAGLFLLTAPDPRLALIEQPLGLRRVIRAASLATLALIPVKLATDGVLTARGGDPLAQAIVDVFIVLCSGTAWTVSVAGGLEYMARLAERMPDARLTRECRGISRQFAWWGAVLSIGLASAHSAFSMAIKGPLTKPAVIVPALVAGYAGMSAGIALFWHVGSMSDTFERYRRALERLPAPVQRGEFS